MAALAERPGDRADLFLERTLETVWRSGSASPAITARSEEGLAARLVRDGRSYLVSADELSSEALAQVLRGAARAQPRSSPPPAPLAIGPSEPAPAPQILGAFASEVEAALRARLVAFPLRLAVREHRRAVQVVGTRLVPEASLERFWSVAAETPWGGRGRLLARLAPEEAQELAESLTRLFRAREAPPPPPGRHPVLLSPQATAVFLHEAIAHSLEADLLALAGGPEAMIGVELAPSWMTVLDDPSAAPAGLARATDDEGLPVLRRFLLRQGRVEQPLADADSAEAHPSLLPGAGWRGSRHLPPSPRSRFLEMLPGDLGLAQLLRRAEGGLWVGEIERGALDPASGRVTLALGAVQRIRGAERAEAVGACRLAGGLAELLAAAAAAGHESTLAGAGWCAKGGQRLAVWAKAPSLLLAEAEIVP